MRLLIDIGNTRIKGALEQNGELHALPAAPYHDDDLLPALESWSIAGRIQSCWVASVGHADLCRQIEGWLQAHHDLSVHYARSTASTCGVTNAYAEPGNLGVDRWLSLIAAHARGGPAVIVSAGTAATIDVLDGGGRHLGGRITPGLATMRKAMLDHTQVRARVTDHPGLELLGDSTDACVTYGTLHALLGYIEITMDQLPEQADAWRCFISGGDAEYLLPYLRGNWQLAPNLVLEGLGILAQASEG